jgi:hypothetical protein
MIEGAFAIWECVAGRISPLPTPVHIDKRVLVFLLAVMVCLNAAVLWNNRAGIAAGRNDFPIFYSNAQIVREGKASALYDFNSENGFTHRVTDIPRPPNNHLPYELLLFVPFTHLQFVTAYALWTILGLAMLVGVAAVVQKLYGTGSSFSLNLLTIVAFYPAWYCLIDGEDSILLLLLFAISFWLWKRGKDDIAGFVLALGLFRPQLVLPFVFIALLAGKWKFVRGFIPGAALAVALSAWVVGVNGMLDYARILLSQGTEKSASVLADRWEVRPGLMPTWRGFLWICLPNWVPSWLRTLFLLSGTALGLGWATKKMRAAKGSAALDMTFAIALATVLLVSFHSYLNDFSLMILPLLIWRPLLATSDIVPKQNAHVTVTLCFLVFCTPLYLLLFATNSLGLLFPVLTMVLWLASRWETISEAALDGGQLPRAISVEGV